MADGRKPQKRPRDNSDAALIRRILFYSPRTGFFRWKYREDYPPQWNSRYADKKAGATNNLIGGYIYISVYSKLLPAQRIAWIYVTGKWPRDEIDHINTKRHDNRWNNLRQANRKQNSVNRGANRNNKIGIKWVSKMKNKWRAQCGGHIGMFNTPEEAHAAALKVAKKRHGNFVRAK